MGFFQVRGKQKACPSTCGTSTKYQKKKKKGSLPFQIISKTDETHPFYFNVSTEQVVLVAVANISRDLTAYLPIGCHTIVSELAPFPVKKSQKLVTGDVLLSSAGVCLTQMLLSVDPLRLEQLKPSWPLRSWS